jgi:hypothetical protein
VLDPSSSVSPLIWGTSLAAALSKARHSGGPNHLGRCSVLAPAWMTPSAEPAQQQAEPRARLSQMRDLLSDHAMQMPGTKRRRP